MNKTLVVIYFFLLLTVPIAAQSFMERQLIVESYDTDKIQQLKEGIVKRDLLRQERVANFIHKSGLSLTVRAENTFMRIYDVIDGKPIYMSTDNSNCAKATNTDDLHPGGGLGLNLEGENMIVGVWDGESARDTHVEFGDSQMLPQTRITYGDSSGGVIDDHATRVAGTIIAKGVNSSAKGMAPKAEIKSFDFGSAESEMITEAGNGLLLSNHSYGFPIFTDAGTQQFSAEQIGNYSSVAQEWDDILFNAQNFLAVTSAGNEGDKSYTGGLAPGYDKLTHLSTVKNNLVVASASITFSESTGNIQFFARSSFSSQGPTDDFRIKPDIAGRGQSVFSSSSSTNSSYNTQSGTSFSAPNVTGSLVLLQEYYNQLNAGFMKSATLRGLACHTALDDDEDNLGPDPFIGWGLLDAEQAALTIQGDSNGTALISELSLSEGNSYTYSFNASAAGSLKATICWTDPSGTISNSPNNILSPRLVNDLDLRIEDASNTIFMPWKLDNTDVTAPAIKGDNSADNIERIDIDAPIGGAYTLTVTHKNTLTNGSQPFSLIITGNNITLGTSNLVNIDYQIWPNPVEDKLYIKSNSSLENQISIYDIHGRIIYSDKEMLSRNFIIDVSNYSSGIYVLKINDGLKTFKQKIIIK